VFLCRPAPEWHQGQLDSRTARRGAPTDRRPPAIGKVDLSDFEPRKLPFRTATSAADEIFSVLTGMPLGMPGKYAVISAITGSTPD